MKRAEALVKHLLEDEGTDNVTFARLVFVRSKKLYGNVLVGWTGDQTPTRRATLLKRALEAHLGTRLSWRKRQISISEFDVPADRWEEISKTGDDVLLVREDGTWEFRHN